MYALVTNLWDSDLHLNSILLRPISETNCALLQTKHQIPKPGSASANQYIISTFELDPRSVLNHGFRTQPKRRPKRGRKIVLETPQTPQFQQIIHNKTTDNSSSAPVCTLQGDMLDSHMNEPSMTKEQAHQCKHKPND